MAVFGNNDQIVLTTAVVAGPAVELTLSPNLGDVPGDYEAGVAGPTRLLVPGDYTQEDLRLKPNVVAAIEAAVADGLQATDKVFIEVDQAVTPRWDNQIEVIFLNAARARISTHKYVAEPVGIGTRKICVETLP